MEDKKYKILIIEDEALVARELKGRLTGMGYEVVGIGHGAESTELARQTNPDLLLTDIHLKDGQDGIALAQGIRAERDVPVVFLTAYSDEATVSRAKEVTPYGYIIKPVENRELEIAIEMALYKFNIERELRETQQLLQTALTCIGSALVFVGEDDSVGDLNADAEELFGLTRRDAIGRDWTHVIDLERDTSVGRKVATALQSREVTKLAPFLVGQGGARVRLVDGIVGPMERGAVLIVRKLSEIHDPVEMFAAPDAMMADVGEERLAPSESSMCQVLIAVDGPGDEAETLMTPVLQRLNQMLRATDLVSRFGQYQLSVSMPYTSVEEGRQIAQSILKGLTEEVGTESTAVFSIGLSSTTPGDQQPFELFRRAGWALNVARESGGHRVILWNENSEQPTPTGRSEDSRQREYHNLLLLWNVMNVVVKATGIEESGARLVQHVQQSFGFDKVALLEFRGETLGSIAGAVAGRHQFNGVGDLGLTQDDFFQVRQFTNSPSAHASFSNRHLFAVMADAALYIETDAVLDDDEVDFLQTLAGYFATRFGREPVDELASDPVAHGSELLFRSPRMQSIVDSVHLVAPTDATVLIVGESGTGKEKLARAIHDASHRSGEPFVIVDCGAVVGSLIESELFGHVKGAFTGADRDFSGRLKEANRGTLLLDEIGELPLDVQVKLLRFVQEQQIAAVGSNRYETVDTRIVAATNRDLGALAKSGAFREDLYYRLNVFTIETPPLRDREGDVLLLARHYLTFYARRYGKPIEGFTEDAERALVQQEWPGNVRELMNIINRAVILCRDSTVSNIHLGLFPSGDSPTSKSEVPSVRMSLETWLSQLVDTHIDEPDLPPLAQWLEDDLILTALSISSDVLNRAAQTLGVPESTLRRKVTRLRADPVQDRPRHNDSIARLIDDLVRIADETRKPVLDVISYALLRELETRRLNRRDAAALMGVSLPTYRKMLNEAP